MNPVVEMIKSWFVASDGQVNWMTVTIVSSVLIHVWEVYLDHRQMYKLQHFQLGDEFRGKLDMRAFSAMRDVSVARIRFNRLESTVGLVLEVLVLVLGLLVFLHDTVLPVILPNDYDTARAVLFLLMVSCLSTAARLPLEVYRLLAFEQAPTRDHSPKLVVLMRWVKDQLLVTSIQLMFGISLFPLLLRFLQAKTWPDWILIWGFVALVTIFVSDIYPNLLAPLFHRFKVLPEGVLRSEIMALAGKVKFPVKEVYRVDVSQRSAHSNAFLMGFGKQKRIVMYDTLLKQLNLEEVLAIIAHELGHDRKLHVWIQMALQLVFVAGYLALFSMFMNDPAFYRSFGFANVASSGPHTRTAVGLTLFSYMYLSLALVSQFLQNLVSRQFEYAADQFSAMQGCVIEQALICLQLHNVSNLCPDPMYSRWNYSHPSLVERLRQLQAYRARTKSHAKVKTS